MILANPIETVGQWANAMSAFSDMLAAAKLAPSAQDYTALWHARSCLDPGRSVTIEQAACASTHEQHRPTLHDHACF